MNYYADTSFAVFPVRFLVQGMALFRDSLAQWAPVKKDGSTNDRGRFSSQSTYIQPHNIFADVCDASHIVLTKEFVEDAVKLLVTRFIPLDPSDLEGWMSDPEEWVNLEEKDNEQWEYELRVGAVR